MGHLNDVYSAYQSRDDVHLIEVFDDTTNPTDLGYGGWSAAQYPLMAVEQVAIFRDDYSSAASWKGNPTLPLIDLQTMKVLVDDCFDYPAPFARDYVACIQDHL